MSIADFAERSKGWVLAGILALSSTASFGLGVMAGREQGSGTEEGDFQVEEGAPQPAAVGAAGPVRVSPGEAGPVTGAREVPANPIPATAPITAGSYVASKTGTKYYLPWCGTAKRIKEENRVWFASKAEAEAAGYQPAANCKGM